MFQNAGLQTRNSCLRSTMNSKVDKRALKENLSKLLKNRITSIEIDIRNALIEASENSKSSAGDKHEVGYELQASEIEKLHQRVEELKRMLFGLDQVEIRNHSSAEVGSLLETTSGLYFISIPFGQLKHEQQTIYVISPQSPLAQAFMGKKVGQTVTFNGLDHRILVLV